MAEKKKKKSVRSRCIPFHERKKFTEKQTPKMCRPQKNMKQVCRIDNISTRQQKQQQQENREWIRKN